MLGIGLLGVDIEDPGLHLAVAIFLDVTVEVSERVRVVDGERLGLDQLFQLIAIVVMSNARPPFLSIS